jgi:tetratricopeptide (TPR) repeat protein
VTTLAIAMSLAAALPAQDSVQFYAEAESLLEARQLSEARAILREWLDEDRRDARALTLLGRVYVTWGAADSATTGWHVLEEAWELTPEDPAIPYWQARAGLQVNGRNSEWAEWAIRDGLYRVWNLDPAYRDTWELWRHAYHGTGELEQAVEILARRDGVAAADVRRAQLLIDLNHDEQAELILARMVSAGHTDASVWALRAQGALEAGDTASGLAHYGEAVRTAATDTLGILWQQIEMIASPAEVASHASAAPDEWPAFFAVFWARREPDLNTEPNERIVEHFARLRRARQDFRLLFPQAAFHTTPARRAVVANVAPSVFVRVQRLGVPGILPQMSARLEADLQRAGVGTDVRDLPEPDTLSRYRRYGFDGRGLIYLRFGNPERRYVEDAVEAWYYQTADKPQLVVFARATSAAAFAGGASLGGDMVVFPTTPREVSHSVELLQRDTTSVTATLDVHAWVASFRGAVRGMHLVYVGATPDTGAAALWDDQWTMVDRRSGVSPIRLHVEAGPYTLGLDVQRDGELGRLRADVAVPDLWRDQLTVSSLLVGAVADTGFGREEVAAAMPGIRRLQAGVPLALYSEIYELPADAAGLTSYEVEYAFLPEGAGDPISVSFERTVTAAPIVPERVVLAPGRVPRGTYTITMTVRVAGLEEESTIADVELR